MNTKQGASRPLISIIIPTLKKRPESLKRLLDSIKKYTKNYEIIFAEGGDCYSASMNNGLRKAKGEYLTIPGIADDIEVTEGWVDELYNDGMGVFHVYKPDGSLESMGGYVMPERFNTNPESEPDYGGYGIVSRNIFEKVGYMDENFKPIYCEDADYGLRVKKSGYKNKVIGGKIIHHSEYEGREGMNDINKEYLWKKHNLK